MDPEAQPIYRRIENFENEMMTMENRAKFIAFMKGDYSGNRYDLKNLSIDVFDDELLTLFDSTYSSASNEQRRDMCILLIDMSFENKQMKTTIQNLKKLLQKMNTLLHSWNKRTIDLIITKEFTDKLQKKISSLELSTKNNSEIDSDERGITI